MRVIFRATDALFAGIRADLARRHPFASERVGFIGCRASALLGGCLICAADYFPVADDDYLRDDRVGAMMGPAAIRQGLQLAYAGGACDTSVFHVHMHEHRGPTNLSKVDWDECRKFVPDFFNVAPRVPHGMLVLSLDNATGFIWQSQAAGPARIGRVSSVGAQLQMWEWRS